MCGLRLTLGSPQRQQPTQTGCCPCVTRARSRSVNTPQVAMRTIPLTAGTRLTQSKSHTRGTTPPMIVVCKPRGSPTVFMDSALTAEQLGWSPSTAPGTRK